MCKMFFAKKTAPTQEYYGTTYNTDQKTIR